MQLRNRFSDRFRRCVESTDPSKLNMIGASCQPPTGTSAAMHLETRMHMHRSWLLRVHPVLARRVDRLPVVRGVMTRKTKSSSCSWTAKTKIGSSVGKHAAPCLIAASRHQCRGIVRQADVHTSPPWKMLRTSAAEIGNSAWSQSVRFAISWVTRRSNHKSVSYALSPALHQMGVVRAVFVV